METLLETLKIREIVGSLGVATFLFVAASLLVVGLEVITRRDARFLGSRAFINDALYSLFYQGGIYDAVLWTLVANAVQNHFGFMQTGLLTNLPMVVSVPIFWLVSDFLFYWLHRAQHRYSWLWAFHAVHHGELELNSLSQMRRHPLEHLMTRFVRFFPLAFILGLPSRSWIPLAVAMTLLQALHHAHLNWKFGPLYRWVVSPVFHSIHHSSDPDEIDTNFGTMFSFWDYLFGTAADRTTRPKAFGLTDDVVPENLWSQLIYPFKVLWPGYRKSGGSGAG